MGEEMTRQVCSSIAWGVLFLLSAAATAAQDKQPLPRTEVRTQPAPGNESNTMEEARRLEREKAIARKRNKHRLNKKFWALWITTIGLAVADVETTAHCVQRPECQEANPLFGKRPSRARMYAIKGGVTALAFYLSQEWKRDQTGGSYAWWAPPLILAGTSGAGVVNNSINLSRSSPPSSQLTTTNRASYVFAQPSLPLAPSLRLRGDLVFDGIGPRPFTSQEFSIRMIGNMPAREVVPLKSLGN